MPRRASPRKLPAGDANPAQMAVRDRAASALVSLVASMVVFAPPFLASCLVAGIGGSFAFGPIELGIMLSVYYATGALASLLAGIWVDRIGARAALVGATALTAASTLGAGLAGSWVGLVLSFGIGGAGAGIAGPAATRLLVSTVAARRRAVAMAVRQSAAPLAAILAGLFAATAQGWVGWRAAFMGFAAIAGATALVSLAWGREGAVTAKAQDGSRLRRDTIAWLICGAVLMGAAVSAFSGFVVTTGIALGISAEAAALLLAVASAAAVVARLASGWAADRRTGGHLIRVAVLMVLGAATCIIVAAASSATLFVPAIIALSMTAWSSNGLYMYAVVNHQAHAPAKATSIVQVGGFSGCAVGPFLFGYTIEHSSARAAWLFLACWLLLCAGAVIMARRSFRRPSRPAA